MTTTETSKPPEAQGGTFVFPPHPPCPRCHQNNNTAKRTDSLRGIQYRQCRTPICCGYRFPVKGQWVEHAEAQETAGGRFQCPHCDKDYARQSGLTRHINREHPDIGKDDDDDERS